MAIRTLRVRLTLWYLSILGLTLCVFAALLYLMLARSLYRHHDQELEAQATRLQLLLEGAPASAVRAAIDAIQGQPALLLVRDASGAMIHGSSSLAEQEPNIGRHQVLVHAATVQGSAPQFFTATLERLGSVRFICVPVGQQAYLQIGLELGDVDHALGQIARTALVLVPVVLALASVGGVVIARRALAPITDIVHTAETIQATDLSRRIEVQPRDEELAGLVGTLNNLLARLDQAFTSLRDFVADASHQLQTPLTVLKGSIELARTTPRDAPATTRLLHDLAEEVEDMAAVIGDLRALSLADMPVARGTLVAADFSRVCREVAEIAGALGEMKNIQVDARVRDDVWVAGDTVRLKQLVLNLAENAVKYTPPDGHVEIALDVEADDAVLQVIDSGPGIAPADLPHVFERFYRATPARHASTEGTGLGLAIVKRLVEAHGGALAVRSEPGQGASFTVRLRRRG